jgi:photosystem II stability/assembly factor-like uncharacterized protein
MLNKFCRLLVYWHGPRKKSARVVSSNWNYKPWEMNMGCRIWIIIFFAAAGLFGTPVFADWEWLNPVPSGNDYSAISGSGAGYVCLAGDAGTVFEYSGGGFEAPYLLTLDRFNDVDTMGEFGIMAGEYASVALRNSEGWRLDAPPATEWFYGAAVSPDGQGWICGDLGTIYHYDGSGWNQMASGTSTTLKDIEMLDGCGWAVGLFGTARIWDGSNWQYTSSGTTRFLRRISAFNCNHAWAVGDLGTIIFWNGTGFTVETSNTSENLYGVIAVGEEEAWAVGDHGMILHRSGGIWVETSVPEFSDIDFRAAGYDTDTSTLWIAGKHGFIARYDGSDWERMDRDQVDGIHLYDCETIPWSGNILVSGESGNLYEYDGENFTGQISGTSENL